LAFDRRFRLHEKFAVLGSRFSVRVQFEVLGSPESMIRVLT